MLETALALHTGNQPLQCPELDELVAFVCSEAKARQLPAERVIIELKRVWYSVPETPSHQKGDVISRLVTMCILGYYDGHPQGIAIG